MLGGGEPKNLTARYDFDVDGGLTGDQRAPRGAFPSDPRWTADGRGVLIATTERGAQNMQRIDADTGDVKPVTRGQQEVETP